jgi:SCY1-like protein 2
MISSKVQERALKTVPGLCETIDFAEVQGVLFPRVQVCQHASCVEVKPSILSLKVGIHENAHLER